MICPCVTATIWTVYLETVKVVFKAKQSQDEQLNFLVEQAWSVIHHIRGGGWWGKAELYLEMRGEFIYLLIHVGALWNSKPRTMGSI